MAGFRSAYCAWLCAALIAQWPRHMRWVRARGMDRAVPRLLNGMPLPRLGARGVAVAAAVAVGCLAAGVDPSPTPQWAMFAAAGATLVYFAQVIEHPDVRRKPNTVPVILLILGLAGVAAGPAEAWCIIAIKLLVAQMYLSSGLVKVRRSGWRWVTSPTLRIIVLRYYLRDDNRIAGWLLHRPVACRVASAAVLAFELSFWLIIPFPVLAWVYVPLGLVFHLGTAASMRIHYWIYVIPAYFVFLFPR